MDLSALTPQQLREELARREHGVPVDPPAQLTEATLGEACRETQGLIEAILHVAPPVNNVPELVAYLQCIQNSPVHLRGLLAQLQPEPQRR